MPSSHSPEYLASFFKNRFGHPEFKLISLHLTSICSQMRYTLQLTDMIKTFRHKGLERFFREGTKAGIQAAHASRLRLQLLALDQAVRPEDLSAPAWKLHPLKGDMKGHWAVTVNGNWRMVFAFDGTDAVLVDYRDYH